MSSTGRYYRAKSGIEDLHQGSNLPFGGFARGFLLIAGFYDLQEHLQGVQRRFPI